MIGLPFNFTCQTFWFECRSSSQESPPLCYATLSGEMVEHLCSTAFRPFTFRSFLTDGWAGAALYQGSLFSSLFKEKTLELSRPRYHFELFSLYCTNFQKCVLLSLSLHLARSFLKWLEFKIHRVLNPRYKAVRISFFLNSILILLFRLRLRLAEASLGLALEELPVIKVLLAWEMLQTVFSRAVSNSLEASISETLELRMGELRMSSFCFMTDLL